MSTNSNDETLVKRLSQLSLDNRMAEIAMLHAAQTDCLSIALPRGLGFMSKPLKDGNSKIDKSVLVFDLPAVESCRNCASCAKTCYAVKAQVQYWEVLAKRSTNFWLAKNEPAFLFGEIRKQLSRTRKEMSRIHASGEYFSQEYVDFWTEIVESFPKIKFYSYTKMESKLDFSYIERLPNFNLIYSILPNGKRNYGPEAEMLALSKATGFPICPYRKGMKNPPHCGKCKICLTHKYVLFVIH